MKQLSYLSILGVPFAKVTMKDTLNYIIDSIDNRQTTTGIQIVTANPEIVMYGVNNSSYMEILHEAELVLADGIGVVIASKKWGEDQLPERVAGYDLLHELMNYANQHQKKVFLLGASEEVNQLAFEKLQDKFPNAELVGRRNGFFKAEEDAVIIEQIKQVKPDFLFVALGFPKQEEWIAQYKEQLEVPVMMGVGGSFDGIAGKVKRAPMIWQKLYLEWLYRLIQEPKRWRRMLVLPLFLVKALFTPKEKHRSERKVAARKVKR